MPLVRRPVRHAVTVTLLTGALLALAIPAAAAVRLVAADANGVTLRVSVGEWSLSAPRADGRVRVTGLSESHEMAIPGRAMLPAWAATLAIPRDARPTARVIASEGEQTREARIVIAGRPVFIERPGSRLGAQPAVEPVDAIVDGEWPEASVDLGAPFGFRGRRFMALEIRPFRYDEATARVSAPRTLTVRVDFRRPAGASALPAPTSGARDRHVDPALETSVLNFEQARGWRVAPSGARDGGSLFGRRGAAPAKAAVFEEDFPEVRVTIRETALHRLPFDDLVTHGYREGVPVSDVSVHRHEYLENASPPYETIELPSEVHDANGNGTFDSGDAVLVWVRTWAERSNATNIRRFWGDAEVVFVTEKPGGGLRVAHRPGWNNVPSLTPLASYPFLRHFERDASTIMQFVPVATDTNIALWHWTEASLYYSRPDTIRIPVNDLDNTKDASITVRWVGRRSDYHFMWAAIRNASNVVTTVVDSAVWYGKQPFTRSAIIPGTALSEGNNNFFRQWGKNGFGAPDPATNSVSFAGLDWFDLTYWRRYRAVQDYVRFNSADGTGDVQMSVGGFVTDSLRLYDVTDPNLPVRVTLDAAHVSAGPSGFTFEFQDVVAGGRREYVAAALAVPGNPTRGPRTPAPGDFSRVNRQALWNNVAGDYLLVVPSEFASETAQLAAFRRSQGLSVIEATVQSVFDEFDGGRRSGHAIERFAKYAYEQWDSRFLMLVGDGTLDPMKVRATSGTDWIPVLPTPGPVGTQEGVEIIPSDNRFAFITGKEDPIYDLDTNRVVPEMMVGRLTVNSAQDAQTVIQKILKYENLQLASNDWRRNVLLNTDDAFSGDTFFGGGPTAGYCHRDYEEYFVDLNRLMRGFITSDSGVAGMNVEEFNLRSYLTDLEIDTTGFDTCRVSRDDARSKCHASVTPQLLGKLNAGQLLWNYQGHANEFVLTHEDLYVNSGIGLGDDSQRLMNDDKPFVFTAFSCHANMFARPEHQHSVATGPSLGEDFLALPLGRGAVASWASVCYEVVPRNGQDHINVELIRSLFVNPPRDESLGGDDRGSRVVIGEAVLSALFRYLGVAQSFDSERGLSLSYALLGDPATRLSVGKPLSTMLANQQPVTSGQPHRLHTPGPELRIQANVVSNVRIDSLALYENLGAGDVLVPPGQYSLTPAFPDTAAGSLYGGRRFSLDWVQPSIPASSRTYSLVARDRNGLVQRTDLVLLLEGVLRHAGSPIGDNDEVPPSAALSLLLLSPAPIPEPETQITLTVNGAVQSFTAAPVAGDASDREWILSWTHPDYPIDDYVVVASVQGGGSITLRFRVTASAANLAFRDLFPFPNPFDNDGTRFSFMLLGGEPADVKLHVFTQSGRSIYTQVWRALGPGYHQLAWNGNDAEGDPLANGVFFFRLSATTPSGNTTQQLGRLVKLRKPNRVDEPAVP
jgi:hypothetical protein